MATTATIAKLDIHNLSITSIYCHFDGNTLGSCLMKYYQNESSLDELLQLGNIMYLKENAHPNYEKYPNHSMDTYYTSKNEIDETACIAYHRNGNEQLCINKIDLHTIFDEETLEKIQQFEENEDFAWKAIAKQFSTNYLYLYIHGEWYYSVVSR